MGKKPNKISTRWINQTRDDFRAFLDETDWDIIGEGLDLTLICERQLRERIKKILHFPAKPAAFIFQLFPELEQ